MNGKYYNTFPSQNYDNDNEERIIEETYIDSILSKNIGKKARTYLTFPGSNNWQDKEIEGIIEQAGKDHIIISDPKTGEWNLIPIIYLDFITFEEPINYTKQFYN